jgi:hypothetical protein
MRLLITGTGRTGTVWLTHCLIRAGVPARHEVAFSMTRHGTAAAGERPWKVEVSWLAAPYTPVDNCHIIHVVRHPLDCIASRAAWGSFNKLGGAGIDRRDKGRWAMEKCPAIRAGKTAIERAAIHWVRWNEMVKGAAERVHIEDVDAEIVKRWASVVDPTARDRDLELPLRRDTNTAFRIDGRPKPLVWEDVAHVHGLVELAQVYGYL